MQQYLKLLGRNCVVINLDPANEVGGDSRKDLQQQEDDEKSEKDNSALPYDTLFDVCNEIVNLSSVMEQSGLGPNGGLVYCMEYIEAHVDEMISMIEERIEESIETKLAKSGDTGNGNENDRPYLLLDMPGQVELYTHSTCVHHILHSLVKKLDLRLTAIQLLDSLLVCTDVSKFLSGSLLATSIMMRLELPAVSVLSKMDLLAAHGRGNLPMQLDYFTECRDLDRILPFLDASSNSTNTSAAAANNRTTRNTAGKNGDDSIFDDDDEFDIADDPAYLAARRKTRSSNFYKKHQALYKALAETVEDFGLLSFVPLDISSAESVGRVLARIDKSNGYVFVAAAAAAGEAAPADLFSCAIQSDPRATGHYDHFDHHESLFAVGDVQERFGSGNGVASSSASSSSP